MPAHCSTRGVHEVGIAVVDLPAAIRHWQRFGYRIGDVGRLGGAASARLYGVAAALESVRLRHGNADKGLVRLMRWQTELAPGPGLAPLGTPGLRFSVQRTDDLLTVLTHARIAARQGMPIRIEGPVLNARIERPIAAQRPFEEPAPASYNLQIFQPSFQQVVMQRQGVDTRRLGAIDPSSLLRTTEICHVAIVAANVPVEVFDFYADVAGLCRTTQRRLEYDADSPATMMFALQPGESLTEIDFDDPRTADGSIANQSGRLRVFVLGTSRATASVTARPGHHGYCLYSLATADVAALREAVRRAPASEVSALMPDEFGAPSFSFVAPDGYFWLATGSGS